MQISKLIASFVIFCAVAGLALPSSAAVDIGVSVNLAAPPPPVAIAPPPLPVYVVPAPPVAGYVWTPGYWYWGGTGYFWVPGTWVLAPRPGYLWTPGYWGYSGVAFIWHPGYWGRHVGFYGGVNYGGGYNGVGFVGGRWNGSVYVADRAFINAPVVAVNASFNGGPGGLTVVATQEQLAYVHEDHIPPTELQVTHIQAAANNPNLSVAFNHGKPAIAATPRAGDFEHGVIAAREFGARNIAAEQHNIAMKRNPALAKGAALPRANPQNRSGDERGPEGGEHRLGQPHEPGGGNGRGGRPEERQGRPEGGN